MASQNNKESTNMSLETLLEAAEFLEWSKDKKKAKTESRARTPKRSSSEDGAGVPFKRQVVLLKQGELEDVKSEEIEAQIPVTGDIVAQALGDAIPQGIGSDTESDTEEGFSKRCLGNRETHNKLEKARRAYLKECFETLRNELPNHDVDRRASNLATLRSSLRYISQLTSQSKDLDSEKKRMQRLRTLRQAQIMSLKRELKDKGVEYNIDDWIEQRTSTTSTSTASEMGEELVEYEVSDPKVFTESIDDSLMMKAGGTSFGGMQPASIIYETAEPESITLTVEPRHKTDVQTIILPAGAHLEPVTDQRSKLQIKPQPVIVSPLQKIAISPVRTSVATRGPRPLAPQPTQAIQIMQRAAVKASAAVAQKLHIQSVIPNSAHAAAAVPQLQDSSNVAAAQLVTFAQLGSVSQQLKLGGAAPTQTLIIANSNTGSRLLTSASSAAHTIQPITVSLAPSRPPAAQPVRPALAPKQQVLLISAAGRSTTDANHPVARVVMPAPPSQQVTNPPASSAPTSITLGSHVQTLHSMTTATPPSNRSMIPITPISCQNSLGGSAWITGVIPHKAANGTLNYLPVHLTTKPAQPGSVASQHELRDVHAVHTNSSSHPQTVTVVFQSSGAETSALGVPSNTLS